MMNRTQMRDCPSDEIILDYVAGRLSAQAVGEFEQHSETCQRCCRIRAAQTAVWTAMDEWQPEAVTEGFNREVWRRIDDSQASEASGLRGWISGLSLWKRTVPAAAALALVISAVVYQRVESRPDTPASQEVAIALTSDQADQLERALDDVQLLRDVDTLPSAGTAGAHTE